MAVGVVVPWVNAEVVEVVRVLRGEELEVEIAMRTLV
jgi:hypothetical protein